MSALTEEATLFRRSVQKLLDRSGGAAHDWRAAVDLGLAGLDLTPGGGGLDYLFAAMLELGRHASAQPVLEAALARRFAPDLFPEDRRIAIVAGDGTEGSGARNGRLSGSFRLVEGAEEAGAFLIFCGDGTICAVEADAAGISVTATPALLDGLADVRFSDTPIVAEKNDPALYGELYALFRLGLCMRALGAAERGFELAVEHAAIRRQFGQAIGSFQAIQHKLADSHIVLTACREQLHAALRAYEAGADWQPVAMAASAFAGLSLRKVALETQHCLGAIGFAEEHAAPALFRRVHGDVARLGIAGEQRIDLARHILAGGPEALAALLSADNDRAAAFRARVTDWLTENWSDADREALRERPYAERNWNPELMARLGRDGWTTLNWPREAGGMDADPIEQLAFSEAMLRAGAPEHALICPCRIMAPAIIGHGSEELRAAMLPRLRAGEVTGCLGYSEPEAGSDLASLRTRAVRDGDDYIVTGQKAWTTDGHRASHMILAARTDPGPAKRHRGISLFIVPMDAPGISVRPIDAMYGHKFCDTFLDEVRVPAAWRLGAENGGWAILSQALAHERVSMGGFVSQLAMVMEALVETLARDEGARSDRRLLDRLGALIAELCAARRLVLASLAPSDGGHGAMVAAAMAKVYSGELAQRIAESAIDLLGGDALLGDGAPGAPARGLIEQTLRTSIMYVVGGGSNEIQRSLIARRGLGLGA